MVPSSAGLLGQQPFQLLKLVDVRFPEEEPSLSLEEVEQPQQTCQDPREVSLLSQEAHSLISALEEVEALDPEVLVSPLSVT